MWIRIADTMVVLPNGLFTHMENVINESLQVTSRGFEKLCESAFVTTYHHSVQINILVNNVKQSVVSSKDKGRLGIKVLLYSVRLIWNCGWLV